MYLIPPKQRHSGETRMNHRAEDHKHLIQHQLERIRYRRVGQSRLLLPNRTISICAAGLSSTPSHSSACQNRWGAASCSESRWMNSVQTELVMMGMDIRSIRMTHRSSQRTGTARRSRGPAAFVQISAVVAATLLTERLRRQNKNIW